MVMPLVPRYFAYGSNMNVARVQERRLPFITARPATLRGYQLLFDKVAKDHMGCGHANIAPHNGFQVEGVLYELVHADDILIMDRFEQTPRNYSREVITVFAEEGPINAWTYIANPAVRAPGRWPERAYLDHLLAGAPFLSTAYVSALRSIQVVDVEI
jgi:gamma-glutamylcyclotransferase (GGCT)/AIG2-like uncharacterized protein YtfP